MANRYWVGGTATWDGTAGTKWATSSGGTGGASVPTSADDVFFDAASGAVTVTIGSGSVCSNFNSTGFTGTFSGSATLTCYGTIVTIGAAGTWAPNTILSFQGSGTVDLTTNGKLIYKLIIGGSKTLRLADDVTIDDFQQPIDLQSSSSGFLANGKTVTFRGSADYITNTYFPFTGSRAFYNLTIRPATASTARGFITSVNIEVTNALVIDSNSTDFRFRFLIKSDIRGTSRTITCNGTVTANYCDFEDIVGAGSASWNLSAATGGSGDCGGNSGITFTTPATKYADAAANTLFSSATQWFTATNGGGSVTTPPLPQDTARLDANTGTNTWTQNLQRIGSIDCTGFTGTLTTSTTCSVYGSITLSSGMTFTASAQAYSFNGRGSYTLTSAGKTWVKQFTIDSISGTLTLGDTLNLGTNYLYISSGTFSAVSYNVTCGLLNTAASTSKTLNMGSGTWTVGASAAFINFGAVSGLTLNAGTSSLVVGGTTGAASLNISSGSVTLYDFTLNAGGPITLTQSNLFNKITVGAGRTLKLTASTTTTAADWVLTGTSGNNAVLQSTSTTNATVAKSGAGTVQADYCTITDITAQQTNTFYATNSTLTDATNWIAGTAPAAAQSSNLFFGSNF